MCSSDLIFDSRNRLVSRGKKTVKINKKIAQRKAPLKNPTPPPPKVGTCLDPLKQHHLLSETAYSNFPRPLKTILNGMVTCKRQRKRLMPLSWREGTRRTGSSDASWGMRKAFEKATATSPLPSPTKEPVRPTPTKHRRAIRASCRAVKGASVPNIRMKEIKIHWKFISCYF